MVAAVRGLWKHYSNRSFRRHCGVGTCIPRETTCSHSTACCCHCAVYVAAMSVEVPRRGQVRSCQPKEAREPHEVNPRYAMSLPAHPHTRCCAACWATAAGKVDMGCDDGVALVARRSEVRVGTMYGGMWAGECPGIAATPSAHRRVAATVAATVIAPYRKHGPSSVPLVQCNSRSRSALCTVPLQ